MAGEIQCVSKKGLFINQSIIKRQSTPDKKRLEKHEGLQIMARGINLTVRTVEYTTVPIQRVMVGKTLLSKGAAQLGNVKPFNKKSMVMVIIAS